MIDLSLKDLKKLYTETYAEKCQKYPQMEENSDLEAVNRIIAIGDLHGDLNETINIFKLARLIEYNDSTGETKWIGGDTVVVQVGDQIDRCRSLPCSQMKGDDENSDIKILKLLTKLHTQAMEHGGAIYSLVGNHELMNVTGRMEYVSPANIIDFEKKEENEQFFKNNPEASSLKGIDARAWAFKPGNPIAEFLACTRKLVLKIGSTIFVHAGIVPEIANKYTNLNDLNKILSLYLWNKLGKPEVFEDVLGSDVVKGQTLLNRSNVCRDKNCFEISPLWNREIGRLEDNKESCNRIFNAILHAYGAKRMVVGHTPQIVEGINSICNRKLIFVDYAASAAFNRADYNIELRGTRSESRKTQVLEILNDNELNIIKATNSGPSVTKINNREKMNSITKKKRKSHRSKYI